MRNWVCIHLCRLGASDGLHLGQEGLGLAEAVLLAEGEGGVLLHELLDLGPVLLLLNLKALDVSTVLK